MTGSGCYKQYCSFTLSVLHSVAVTSVKPVAVIHKRKSKCMVQHESLYIIASVDVRTLLTFSINILVVAATNSHYLSTHQT